MAKKRNKGKHSLYTNRLLTDVDRARHPLEEKISFIKDTFQAPYPDSVRMGVGMGGEEGSFSHYKLTQWTKEQRLR